jgi:hypothetical protein
MTNLNQTLLEMDMYKFFKIEALFLLFVKV